MPTVIEAQNFSNINVLTIIVCESIIYKSVKVQAVAEKLVLYICRKK